MIQIVRLATGIVLFEKQLRKANLLFIYRKNRLEKIIENTKNNSLDPCAEYCKITVNMISIVGDMIRKAFFSYKMSVLPIIFGYSLTFNYQLDGDSFDSSF